MNEEHGHSFSIPQALIQDIIDQAAKPNVWTVSLLPPFVPPTYTRRQRIKRALRFRWWGVKRYVKHLGLALLGRCDREGGYDW